MEKFNLDETNKIKSVFEVPEGYFDALPQRIQKRIQSNKKQSFWQPYLQPKYALAIASVTLLLVFGGKFLISNSGNKEVKSLVNISEQEIRQYLLNDDIQEMELVNFYIQASDIKDNSNELLFQEEILEEEVDLEDIKELL